MFSLHSDEETKTALLKPTQTILLQSGHRKSVMILLLCLTRKKQPKMHKNINATKRKTIQEAGGFQKETRRRWISTLKATHKTSVKGRCNDGARCCAGTQCFPLNVVM
jgi:hypothetical protein